MIAGFKEFIARGNAIDLAVGVVIGAAFTEIVTTLVDNVINPLVGLFGVPSLDRLWVWTIRPAEGDTPATEVLLFSVVTALINFLIVAVAVYLLVVVPMNRLAARRKEGDAEPVAPSDDVIVLTEIRDLIAAQSGRGPAAPQG